MLVRQRCTVKSFKKEGDFDKSRDFIHIVDLATV